MSHYMQRYHGRPLTPLRKYTHRPDAPEGYSYCTKCEAFKKLDDFYSYPNGNPHSRCKPCQIAKGKERYRAGRVAV
jgi:hypothetical protein